MESGLFSLLCVRYCVQFAICCVFAVCVCDTAAFLSIPLLCSGCKIILRDTEQCKLLCPSELGLVIYYNELATMIYFNKLCKVMSYTEFSDVMHYSVYFQCTFTAFFKQRSFTILSSITDVVDSELITGMYYITLCTLLYYT